MILCSELLFDVPLWFLWWFCSRSWFDLQMIFPVLISFWFPSILWCTKRCCFRVCVSCCWYGWLWSGLQGRQKCCICSCSSFNASWCLRTRVCHQYPSKGIPSHIIFCLDSRTVLLLACFSWALLCLQIFAYFLSSDWLVAMRGIFFFLWLSSCMLLRIPECVFVYTVSDSMYVQTFRGRWGEVYVRRRWGFDQSFQKWCWQDSQGIHFDTHSHGLVKDRTLSPTAFLLISVVASVIYSCLFVRVSLSLKYHQSLCL